MATTKIAALRQAVTRRFSSGGGKILSEEEKAAENIYIKKVEQEKLDKLARKGPNPEETTASSSGVPPTDAKASAAASSTSPGASTDQVSTDNCSWCYYSCWYSGMVSQIWWKEARGSPGLMRMCFVVKKEGITYKLQPPNLESW